MRINDYRTDTACDNAASGNAASGNAASFAREAFWFEDGDDLVEGLATWCNPTCNFTSINLSCFGNRLLHDAKPVQWGLARKLSGSTR